MGIQQYQFRPNLSTFRHLGQIKDYLRRYNAQPFKLTEENISTAYCGIILKKYTRWKSILDRKIEVKDLGKLNFHLLNSEIKFFLELHFPDSNLAENNYVKKRTMDHFI